MKTVIFGCGTITPRIAKGFKYVSNNELVGFAARDIERAKAFAEEYGAPLYGNYDYFLNNKDVDAVYIATYNLNHYELIKSCLLHQKHVICEKPMLSSIEENEELFKLAKDNNLLLMEAMKAVFLPINIKVKQMLKDNIIGEIKYIEASFIRGSDFDDNHWIYDLKTGGALKDIGSYCAAIMNFMLERNPSVTNKKCDATNTKADRTAEVTIDYEGIEGHLLVSNEIYGDSSLNIYGTKGYIKIPNFWKVGKGYYEVNGERFELNEEIINDFYYEIQHFTDLVNSNTFVSPIMNKEASNKILLITK